VHAAARFEGSAPPAAACFSAARAGHLSGKREREEPTVKELHCHDLGFDCEASIRAESEDEVLEQARHHGREVHGIELDEEMEHEARELIRDV
jgi:predicted small metal-binding protein